MTTSQPPSTANTTTKPQPIILTPSSISSHRQDTFPSASHGHNLTWLTLLSSPSTPSTSLSAGIATLRPNGYLALHRHRQAEIYYVLNGSAVVVIDNEKYRVGRGTVVFMPGDAEHGVFNYRDVKGDNNEGEGEDGNGEGKGEEDFIWLYIFPEGSFGDVVYRFSEKS
ncbi:cupin domain-containing protein [Aspergillus undulatus]|uniref:cupin domain-containing protein n=1 Tax=Aspergillus undulatus TaxID=1810928 RepID=UPI003CCCB20F